MSLQSLELPAAQLRRRCRPEDLPCWPVGEMPEGPEMLGQARAVDAIEFGLDVDWPGYNIYVSGTPETGKDSLLQHLLERKASTRPTPPDQAYAYNFRHPVCPLAVRCAPGMSEQLNEDIGKALKITHARPDCGPEERMADVCRNLGWLAAHSGDWPDVAAHLARAQDHMRGRFYDPLLDDWCHLRTLVDNAGLTGAPVIWERNVTALNLAGRAPLTNAGSWSAGFSGAAVGALHRANGGYLVLDARSLLANPGAWETLKQALEEGCVRMLDAPDGSEGLAGVALRPGPMPLKLKVIVTGDTNSYYALYGRDEAFARLFKVRADFAADMPWSQENEACLAQAIMRHCRRRNLAPLAPPAVACLIEQAGRLADSHRNLSTRLDRLFDLVQEAAYWSGRIGHDVITEHDVSRALDEQVHRSGQYGDRVRDLIAAGTILIDIAGTAIGQVNALATVQLGDHSFGKPTRVTASTYQGRAGIVNIEREARLSGRLHDKGVLILVGLLGARYAQDKSLSLSAGVAFEQSYDPIDGDSASCAELCALLSSLARLPLKQGIAVTGAVNQHGEVQAVGGVTAKVEGFFDVCRMSATGLTGEQGVIIPAANVQNLMLRPDVVQSVEEGRFHVYAIHTVDEAMEILSEAPAGDRGPDGTYPPESVNGRVDGALRDLADKVQRSGQLATRERIVETVRPEKDPPHEPELPGGQPEPLPS